MPLTGTTLTFVTTATCNTIGDYAFYNCSGLTALSLPGSLTSIGNYAFYGLNKITTLSIPNNVTTVGDAAFEECTSLVTLVVGTKVNSIGFYAFENAPLSTKITINATNLETHNDVFNEKTTGAIAFGSVTQIPDNLFKDCVLTTTKTITIPNTCKVIGNNAFYNMSDITSVTFTSTSVCEGLERLRGAERDCSKC